MYRNLLLTSLLALASCESLPGRHSYVEPIEAAHGAASWRAQSAARMRLRVEFNGSLQLEGTLITAPDGARTRIETADGAVIVSTGDSVHVSPASAANPRMRFHALTWSYFLAAPFKLEDPGSRLEELGQAELDGRTHDLARLTFGAGVGDAPDDWYVLYRDAETGTLSAMAYIVTFGKDPAEVTEADAHAMVYRDFQTVDGVAIPMRWEFYDWSRELGPHGDPIGEVRLAEFHFTEAGPNAFTAPEGSVVVEVP